MKSYEEMKALIIKTAMEDERIRAVTMEGSNVTDGAVHDQYSDFDLTFFVTDVREFSKDTDYMSRFGDVLILQRPDDMLDDVYDYESREKYTLLTQYEDGNRIDLTFFDISHIDRQSEFDEPRTVLINKDAYPELKEIRSEAAFFIQKPSERDYLGACNEFRWLSNYVTKGLCRDELPYAKYMLDELMMNMFTRMLNWKIGIEHDFSVTTGAYSKYLKKYLTGAEMKRYESVLSGADYSDIWEKLFNMYDYFADLARYVAQSLGFVFDEEETVRVRVFMLKRKEQWQESEKSR